MSINHVSISGNLTRDPELRSTSGGMQVLSLGVAVNERVKSQSTGEWEDRPSFVDCVVFGKRAESLSRFLAKGAKVAVSGRLRYSAWEKDGQKRSKLEVVVDELDMMGRGRDSQQPMTPAQATEYMGASVNAPQAAQRPAHGAQAPYSAPAPTQAQPAAQGVPYGQMDLYDEDIPF